MIETGPAGLFGNRVNRLGQALSHHPADAKHVLLREPGFSCELLPLTETDLGNRDSVANFSH